MLNVESNNIGLQLEQSKGSTFLYNGIPFAILQRLGDSLFVKKRFTKSDIRKDKIPAEFFSIGVGKLLGLDEKYLMI